MLVVPQQAKDIVELAFYEVMTERCKKLISTSKLHEKVKAIEPTLTRHMTMVVMDVLIAEGRVTYYLNKDSKTYYFGLREKIYKEYQTKLNRDAS